MLNINHSVHLGITSPSFSPSPFLNLQTIQAPPFFRQFSHIYWFFVSLPLKIGLFSEPQRYVKNPCYGKYLHSVIMNHPKLYQGRVLTKVGRMRKSSSGARWGNPKKWRWNRRGWLMPFYQELYNLWMLIWVGWRFIPVGCKAFNKRADVTICSWA